MNNIDYDKAHQKLDKLMEYAALDGTEWGEMCRAMKGLFNYSDYISDALAVALDCDIEAQLKWAIENCEIVETTETFTRTVKTLEILQ